VATSEVAPAEPVVPVELARWKIGLLVAAFLLLLGALLEFGSRLYLRATEGYDGKHLYQFVYDPYKNILPAPNYVDTRGIRHTSTGFRRSTEVTRAKPPGTYRIFLMGASAAYGLGGLWPSIDPDHRVIKNSETIDAYLERELQDSFPDRKIEVINAAITSTWTHHHLIYLNQTILNYQPDMVLFMDGFNDFFFFEKDHDQFASFSYNTPAERIMGDPTVGSLFYAGGWWLFRKSAFVHLMAMGGRNVILALQGKPAQPPLVVDEAMAGLREVFPRSAGAMHRRIGVILRDEGVKPVFMLQPLLILERDRPGMTPVERRLFDFNIQSWRPGYEEFMRQAVGFVRQQESATATHVGGTFLDLTPIFDGVNGQIFTDYCHLTPQGNAVLAHYVAAHVAPLIAGATPK
jgi:lysophospholipase L1-like esterase